MSKRAEEAALKAYPDPEFDGYYDDSYVSKQSIAISDRFKFIKGYEQAEKDLVSIIQARLNEIQGDAQPRPVLRMELQEIINKIENGDN